MTREKEIIHCPYCQSDESTLWAVENGFHAVKCTVCGLVYVNPRPAAWLISEAVETGVHKDVDHGRSAIGVRRKEKVAQYRKLLAEMFYDVWEASQPVSWIDVGAGYGEIIEAIGHLAYPGSNITGLEPMKPKAQAARARGLNVQEGYLSELTGKYQFLSVINVYSHIPDFRAFLNEAKRILNPNGGILIETGNTADLQNRNEVPGDLDLPDHLVFAGERHLRGYLEEAGFSIVAVKRTRVDGVLRWMKNLMKKSLGRKNITTQFPYTSHYRSLLIRAQLGQ